MRLIIIERFESNNVSFELLRQPRLHKDASHQELKSISKDQISGSAI